MATDPDEATEPVTQVVPATHERRSPTGRADLLPAEPLEGAARTAAPTTSTAEAWTTRGERRRFYVGDLVVRRFRLRSVLKVALAFYLCLFAVLLLAGAILWHLASREGWVTGWTGFLVDVGFTDADVDGATLARASATAGGILAATATLLTVAAASFYNQISGLVGGVEMTFGPRRRRGRERRQPLR